MHLVPNEGNTDPPRNTLDTPKYLIVLVVTDHVSDALHSITLHILDKHVTFITWEHLLDYDYYNSLARSVGN